MTTLAHLSNVSLRLLAALLAVAACGCQHDDGKIHVTIWHQMRVDERQILERQLEKFMERHPEFQVEQLFKETEELRSSYIIGAIAGQGPDLVYGPSDQVGPFQVMDIIRPFEGLFDSTYFNRFNPKALTWYGGHLYQIADKLGNHLTLVYNRDLVPVPPATDLELIEIGQKLTKDVNGDGQPDRYGLVWNYTEPFFFIPFLTGFGGWVMDEDGNPTLNTEANAEALRFIMDLRDKYKIIPGEADYNVADALFKEGKAGMIINGDWSWASYQKAGLNIGIAPLPKITRTGLWCAPMVSPKGYSINSNVKDEKVAAVLEVLRFLLSEEVQLQTAKALLTMPTLIVLYEDPFIRNDDFLQNSQLQIDRGRQMPVVPELRAIWDAMRGPYQAVLGGSMQPRQAAQRMQALALQRIVDMNE